MAIKSRILQSNGVPYERALTVGGGPFFRRDGASRSGSLANWIPAKFWSTDIEAREREDIIGRSINLMNDDPHADGIITSFATTITGAGLRPKPTLNSKRLGITKKQAREIEAVQREIYKDWAGTADLGLRMTDGEIQHLKTRCLFGFGESLEILRMRPHPLRAFSLTSQVINPLRLKTPSDLTREPNLRQGIYFDKDNVAIGYFIKKSGGPGVYLSDISKNFDYIPARKAHRWIVLHDFVTRDPEQTRGFPLLAPSMRFFRDFTDLMGSELISNVVASMVSIFVETEGDPNQIANTFRRTDNASPHDENRRVQEVDPGQIWYGSTGEKPHLLSVDRPGTNFDPFTKLIKKAFSMSTGVPYTVLFKDLDGVSFAGFRSAMLEGWRVYNYHRTRIAQKDPQRKYDMLMEEAYLRDRLKLPGGMEFYDDMRGFTAAEWYGYPKGDIEPYKQIKSDVEKIKNNITTQERVILEHGGVGLYEVLEQRKEEIEAGRELTPVPATPEPVPVEGGTNE